MGNRIEMLRGQRARHNYMIYNSKENDPIGWIIYEIDRDTCFLHLIVIDYKELGKKYAYNSLKKLVKELKSKSIKRISLDVQEKNRKFGFLLVANEEQIVNNDKIEKYLKMKYTL